MNLKNRFGRFIPWGRDDPRVPLVEERPAHYIGEGWTPDDGQIEEARERHAAWRNAPAMQWRRVVDPGELNIIRASIISATTDRGAAERTGESLRILRVLALDAEAIFFERALEHLGELRLVEMRHPRLRVPNGSSPLGLRFIRLMQGYWKQRDFIGLYLDGDREPIHDAFKANHHQAYYSKGLVEQYVSLAFDHLKFENRQFYIVRDRDDFIVPDAAPAADGEPDRFLTAQFQLGMWPGAKEETGGKPDPILAALKIASLDFLIAPTVLELTSEVARVFATVIADRKLYHVGLRVFPDGKIHVAEDTYVQRTAKNETLALIATRSFAEQRAALSTAFAEPADEKAAT